MRTPFDLSLSPSQNNAVIVAMRWFFLIAMTIVLALCVFIFIRFVVFPMPPELPVTVELVGGGIQGEVCPGNKETVTTHVTVLRPVSLEVALSVMDEASMRNIPGTQVRMEPRPHPHAGNFRQQTEWEVPQLPPGKYTLVSFILAHNTASDPRFLIIPFTVKEDCHE